MRPSNNKAIAAGGGATLGVALTWAINHFAELGLDTDGMMMMAVIVSTVLSTVAAWVAPYKRSGL